MRILDLGGATNHFKHLYKQQLAVFLKVVDLVSEGDLAETEAELGLCEGQVTKGVLGQQVDGIFIAHVPLRSREVVILELGDSIEVALEHIVHVNGPQLVISEWLPGRRVEVGLDVVLKDKLDSFVESTHSVCLNVFEVGKSR